MATLVFSVVGAFVGGPIGQAVGAIIGQQIDRAIFAPGAREGPRLGNLAVQTSSYGAAIPKLFGSSRAAGSVIWATDLRETRSTQSNGKGKPKTNIYSYSTSFAVALSARPIARIGRIWADGNLLRGENGDFKTQTGFRLYTGLDGQNIDPLIASVEGTGFAPAYRGLAYALFEDFQLGDYGNRIPSLSFEIIADEAPVSLGGVIADLAGGTVVADASTQIEGFAASGDSVRGAAEVLARAVPLSLIDDGVKLIIREGGPPPVALNNQDLGTDVGARGGPRLPLERRSVLAVPETLSIIHYDRERDYQTSLQSARRDGGARRGMRIDLPATLSAGAAKAMVEARLSGLWAERISAKVRLPWRYLTLRPGDRITLPESLILWRIVSVTLERMVVELDLIPVSNSASVLAADSGRTLSQIDAVHGPTTIMLVDLPPLGDAAPLEVTLGVAAAGVFPGWRRAALLASNDGGITWVDAGQSAAPATTGHSIDVLGNAGAGLIDRINMVEVQLLNNAMLLADADTARLIMGANTAMLGQELIQFGRAEPLGAGRWRLSELLRGRRGTEDAISDHHIGDQFVLIERDAIALLDSQVAQPGVHVMANGIGDSASPPIVSAATVGAALRPLSPVHPRVRTLASGDTHISWIRRSREGWQWRDGLDVALAEERALFRIAITPAGGSPRSEERDGSDFIYSTADHVADQANGAQSVHFDIRHIGARALSPPLTLTLQLI